MNDIVTKNIDNIKKLCIKYNVLLLYVFGSVLTKRYSLYSDIDFIVKFKKIPIKQYADFFFGFKEELEKITGKKIDLVEEETIKNPYLLEEIIKKRKKIYG